MENPGVLSFNDIRFSIATAHRIGPFGKHHKVIINGVSGDVASGELLGIMGPSGSGKTSVLNVISGRLSCSSRAFPTLSGTITYNGRELSSGELRKISAYLPQEDFLFPYLTVKETLMLSARFFLSWQSTQEEVVTVVDAVLSELGLNDVADIIIGSSTKRGISGGEKKRTAIGKQLLSNPSILFLDEPTTGLDAFQAESVMVSLKGLARQGRIVVAVIHQPRSSIYTMLDSLLLVSNGKTVYSGPMKSALTHFAACGYPCPSDCNPADFVIDLVSCDMRQKDFAKTNLERDRVDMLTMTWRARQPLAKKIAPLGAFRGEEQGDVSGEFRYWSYPHMSESKDGIIEHTEDKSSLLLHPGSSKHVARRISICAWLCRPIFIWFRDFFLLLWRSFCEIYRNHLTIAIRFFSILFFAGILSLVFHNLGFEQRNIRDRIGLLFFMTTNQSFGPCFGVLTSFPEERNIVRKEQSNRAYSSSSYFLARVVAEVPLQIILAVAYSSVVYWSAHLNPDIWRFLTLVLLLILDTLCAASLGFAISAAAPSTMIANALGPPILIVFVLFSGFYINRDSLPKGSRWIQYLSFLKWTFEGAAVNEFTGETFRCDPDPAIPCERLGETILRVQLSYQNSRVKVCIIALCILLCGYLFVAYVLLLLSGERYLEIYASARRKESNYYANSSLSVAPFEREYLQPNAPVMTERDGYYGAPLERFAADETTRNDPSLSDSIEEGAGTGQPSTHLLATMVS